MENLIILQAISWTWRYNLELKEALINSLSTVVRALLHYSELPKKSGADSVDDDSQWQAYEEFAAFF